jgi:hypothetical protein
LIRIPIHFPAAAFSQSKKQSTPDFFDMKSLNQVGSQFDLLSK